MSIITWYLINGHILIIVWSLYFLCFRIITWGRSMSIITWYLINGHLLIIVWSLCFLCFRIITWGRSTPIITWSGRMWLRTWRKLWRNTTRSTRDVPFSVRGPTTTRASQTSTTPWQVGGSCVWYYRTGVRGGGRNTTRNTRDVPSSVRGPTTTRASQTSTTPWQVGGSCVWYYRTGVRGGGGGGEEYHQEYKRCTILCEGSHDHESLPDFYNAVAGRWFMCMVL